MLTFDEYMKQFSDSNLDTIIADYECLSKEGSIGECLLRSAAEGWEENIGIHTGIVIVMGQIALYAYQKRYHQLREA